MYRKAYNKTDKIQIVEENIKQLFPKGIWKAFLIRLDEAILNQIYPILNTC